jgi:Peptidase inhibitor I78 family
MFRSIIFAALVLAGAGAAAAQERQAERPQVVPRSEARVPSEDRFVVSDDECGASRYQHLLGREYARVYHAALLPGESVVQNRAMQRTLEYTPQQLNVVVGGDGRIIAIGCF